MIGEEDEVEFKLLFILGHARYAPVDEVVGAGPRGGCIWLIEPAVKAAGVADEEVIAAMSGRVKDDIPAGFETDRGILSLMAAEVLDAAVLPIAVAVADDSDVVVAVASPIVMSLPTPVALLNMPSGWPKSGIIGNGKSGVDVEGSVVDGDSDPSVVVGVNPGPLFFRFLPLFP